MNLKETLYEIGAGLKRWLLPSVFYSTGFALALRTVYDYRIFGVEYESGSKIIQQWLFRFDSGAGVDFGRLVDSFTRFDLSVPWSAIFSIVFLVLAYKLTPK